MISALPKVNIVKRDDVREITSVEVNGKLHLLGEHRDFRRNAVLNHFMPENGRYSFSWVRLRDGEVLANHEHPTQSMIIVCQGSVYVTGEVEQCLFAGDIVCVPPGHQHGFRTESGQEFYGLSIQFEGEGLYENEFDPRVTFLTQHEGPFKKLVEFNQSRLQKHQQNTLFQLFERGDLESNEAKRRNFLEALYIWSQYFQKMMYARQAFCTDSVLRPIYRKHLCEEFGHDTLLGNHYDLVGNVYDPILEAAGQWFVSKMLSADEAEKIVVVHMVVESSGHVFGEATKHIFEPIGHVESYFEVHAELDEDHSDIGLPYLHKLSPAQFPKLMRACQEAWDQMDLIHERIAYLTEKS